MSSYLPHIYRKILLVSITKTILLFHKQVDSAWNTGNFEAARSNSRTAKILSITGIIVGTIITVSIIVIYIAAYFS